MGGRDNQLAQAVTLADDASRAAVSYSATGEVGVWKLGKREDALVLQPPERLRALALSRDGSTLVGMGRDLVLWDLTAIEAPPMTAGGDKAAVAVAVSPDGSLVAGLLSDGSVGLWSGATGMRLATVLAFADGSWAVVDPTGRFDASDADRSRGWAVRRAGESFLPGQLRTTWYRPGLLMAIVG
jgi:WD40 repeat protein